MALAVVEGQGPDVAAAAEGPVKGGRRVQAAGKKNQGFFAHPPVPRLLYKNKEGRSNERASSPGPATLVFLTGKDAEDKLRTWWNEHGRKRTHPRGTGTSSFATTRPNFSRSWTKPRERRARGAPSPADRLRAPPGARIGAALSCRGGDLHLRQGRPRSGRPARPERGGGDKRRRLIAHFQHGPLLPESPERRPFPWRPCGKWPAAASASIFRTKREIRRMEDLIVLAEDARTGRRRLGYYHHGDPAADLEELARRGAWIHVSADPKTAEAAAMILHDVAVRAASEGGGARRSPGTTDSGPNPRGSPGRPARIFLFRTPPSDYRSPYRTARGKGGPAPPRPPGLLPLQRVHALTCPAPRQH